jgi:hypothetical protein
MWLNSWFGNQVTERAVAAPSWMRKRLIQQCGQELQSASRNGVAPGDPFTSGYLGRFDDYLVGRETENLNFFV